MAECERSICFTWGQYFPGREEKGMLAFKDALAYFKYKKERKCIRDFHFGLVMQGNFTSLSGYLVVEGTKEQINIILDDESPCGFHELVSRSRHCVNNYSMSICDTMVPAVPDEYTSEYHRHERAERTKNWVET